MDMRVNLISIFEVEFNFKRELWSQSLTLCWAQVMENVSLFLGNRPRDSLAW